MQHLVRNVRDQKGQALMEYVIVSGLVGVFCLIAVKQFGGVVRERVNHMKEHITKNIQLKD